MLGWLKLGICWGSFLIIISVQNLVADIGSDTSFREDVAFRNLGFSYNQVQNLMQIFQPQKVAEISKYLLEIGFSHRSIVKIFNRYPRLVSHSVESLQLKIEEIKKVTPDYQDFIRTVPQSLGWSTEKIAGLPQRAEEMGLIYSPTVYRDNPRLATYSKERTKDVVAFLIRTWNIDKETLSANSQVIAPFIFKPLRRHWRRLSDEQRQELIKLPTEVKILMAQFLHHRSFGYQGPASEVRAELKGKICASALQFLSNSVHK